MRRLSHIAFGALVVATVAAFFVTQHLKVSTPLIAGFPSPSPAAINPYGASCDGVDHGRMRISFYLLHRSDDVSVYVVDAGGTIIRTLAVSRHMRRSVRTPDGEFSWNGREDNGTVAPDGAYYIRVALLGQGRTVLLTHRAVTVKTVGPRPVVKSVTPGLIPDRGRAVRIRYGGNEHRPATVLIYRTDLPGRPRLMTSFQLASRQPARWNGRLDGRPAPAGTYLVGLRVLDQACNVGRFPPTLPTLPGTTPHAGVTVRYLAAEPPLDPVFAGGRVTVYVDARGHGFSWRLYRVGRRKLLVSGARRRGSYSVRVKLPGRLGPGLYELALQSGPYRTSVPLLARAPGARPRVLVVLPGLTWQGENPVDDDGDGIPNTLATGGPADLGRVLAHGLPQGWASLAAFMSYLDHSHLSYDLTSDFALVDGSGPPLAGHRLVVLAGSERWLPASLGSALRSFVQAGGHVASLGIDSLRRSVVVHGDVAIHPGTPTSADIFGARPGRLTRARGALLLVARDGLGIFSSGSGAFAGFPAYQPFAGVSPPAELVSEAGISAARPAIIGLRLGRGAVVEIGLPGFGQALARRIDAQELVSRLWAVLGR